MESSGDTEGTEPMAAPAAPAAPKKRPWGKIAAVVIVIVVIIAALAIFLRPANVAPTITQATVSSEAADVGQTLTFTGQASDADNDALTYTWNFGDNTTGTGATSTHAYTVPGQYITLLTVDDGRGGVVTNDAKLLFVQVKLAASSVAAPADCPSGATKNSGFKSSASGWTYAPWEGTSSDAYGAYAATGGNLGGHLNITTNLTANSALSGYFYQSFSFDGSTPVAAKLHVGWSVLAFGATGGNTTLYAFLDSTSAAPVIGTEVWTSGIKTATTPWANITPVSVASHLTTAGTYYLKLAVRTQNLVSASPTTGGFDNAWLTWSKASGCAAGNVAGILSADHTAGQTGTTVKFNSNASWAYAFTWNDPTDISQGATYPVTAAADDPTLYSSFTYSWGDGTTNTVGTSTAVGQTTHTFSTVGNFFIRLTAIYANSTVVPSTRTATVGYTVRIIAAAPPVQVKYPDIFTTVTIGEPDYLDPAVDYETAGGEVLQNVYETLIWYQQGSPSVTTIVPRLASAVPTTTNGGISADGKNYTFDLRTGVPFHSGGTMNADDVVYSIQRVLAIHDPDGPSWILEQILTNYVSYSTGGTVGDWVNGSFTSRGDVPPNIVAVIGAEPSWNTEPLTVSLAWAISNSTVEKVNPTRVVFHLTRAYPAFLQAMAFTVGSVLSKSCVVANGGVQWGSHNTALDNGADCGTGPFTISAWVRNQVIVMKRFDTYWRTPAAVKEVHIAKANDISTRELMLLSGDADVAAIGRDHQYDVMNTDGTPKYPTLAIVKDQPTFTVLFFGYNQAINTAATPDPWSEPATFFANVHVRKAFSYAFDYTNFIQNVIFNGGIPLRGPIPQGMLGYNASTPLFTYDLAKAAAELRQTPYWTSGFSITLYYNAGNTVREKGCLLLKAGLEALTTTQGAGPISVNTRALDWPIYLAALRAKALPIFFLGWAPDYADPDDYVVPFLHSGGTFPIRVGYSNTTLDGLIDTAAAELNQTKRDKEYQDLSSDAVIDDVPYLWIYQATSFHVERSWVSGYYFNPMLSGLDYYTLSKG